MGEGKQRLKMLDTFAFISCVELESHELLVRLEAPVLFANNKEVKGC